MSTIGNKEIFSKNLSYYIALCGKEQKEIAMAVGVAPSTFNEWVKGKKYPRIDKIEMLADFFRIKKSDLIEDKLALDLQLFAEKTPPVIELTEGEQLLLDLFRKIPEDKQELVLQMIRVALGSQAQ